MSEDSHKSDDGNAVLNALLRFMEARGLKAGPLAARAGFSPSTIYNLTAGRAKAPSAALLQKIADAEGVKVADIMAYATEAETIAVRYIVVSGGRLIVANSTISVTRPLTIDSALEVDAAQITGDGLHPIPHGWIAIFASMPAKPSALVGQICVIRLKGHSDALIGTIREGKDADSFDVQPWHGPVQQGVQIVAAHKVVAFQPPDTEHS